MPNMSYCKFQNTIGDLRDCHRTMQGEERYYQGKDDLSEEEFAAMTELIELCKEIVELSENDGNILVRPGSYEDQEAY